MARKPHPNLQRPMGYQWRETAMQYPILSQSTGTQSSTSHGKLKKIMASERNDVGPSWLVPKKDPSPDSPADSAFDKPQG